MSKTVKNGKDSRRRIDEVDEDNWNLAFKRNKKNIEKNRYKRGDKNAK